MPRLAPIHYKKFEVFLQSLGCRYIRTEGDHNIWRKEGLKRPVVVRKLKDLPVFEILTNLRTLGVDRETYLKLIEKM